MILELKGQLLHYCSFEKEHESQKYENIDSEVTEIQVLLQKNTELLSEAQTLRSKINYQKVELTKNKKVQQRESREKKRLPLRTGYGSCFR